MIRYRMQPQPGESAIARMAIRSASAALLLSCLLMAGCLKFWGSGSAQNDPKRVKGEEIAALRSQAALQSSEAYWPQRLAEIHFARAQRDSATHYCAEALRRSPDYPAALALRSRLHYELGEHQQAADMLRTADARQALSPALLAGLALHLERLEHYDAADAIYARLEPAPETSSVLIYRRLSGEEFPQALELAEQAVARDPNDAQTLNNHAVALLYAGAPSRAKEQLLRAHALDAKLPGPLYNLAIVDRYYFFDEAASRQWLSDYLRLSSEDPDGLVESFAQADAQAQQEQAK